MKKNSEEQGDLFELGNEPTPEAFTPASHSDDPETSKAAEEEHTSSGARGAHCVVVFELVEDHPNKTASELTDLGPFDLQETRRRLTDLKHAEQVQQCEPRLAVGRTKREVTWRAIA